MTTDNRELTAEEQIAIAREIDQALSADEERAINILLEIDGGE